MKNANYLNLYHTEKYDGKEGEKVNYTKVGVCFPHKEGTGFNLKILDGLSVSGELVAFYPTEKNDDE